jgi:hypothetical protein
MRSSTFNTTCTSFVRLATSTGPPACQLLLTASEPKLNSVAAAEVAALRAVTGAVDEPGAGTFNTPTVTGAVPVAVALLTLCGAIMLLLVLLADAVAAAGCAGMTPGWNVAPACSCTSAATSASATALQGQNQAHVNALHYMYATWWFIHRMLAASFLVAARATEAHICTNLQTSTWGCKC